MNRVSSSAIGTCAVVAALALTTLVAAGCTTLSAPLHVSSSLLPTATSPTASVAATASSTIATPSSSTTATTAGTSTIATSGVTLRYPNGWYSQVDGDSGLRMAEHQEDLTAERPVGARLLLERMVGGSMDMASVLQEVAPAGTDPAAVAGSVQVVEDATQTQVGNEQAASITVKDTSSGQAVVSRYVVVEIDPQTCFLFTLQSPADQWEGKITALEGILRSALFSTPAS
jgi:ABC-type amino acid transport substrate-binding protein